MRRKNKIAMWVTMGKNHAKLAQKLLLLDQGTKLVWFEELRVHFVLFES